MSETAARPLLRSPPFPGVPRKIAAVSAWRNRIDVAACDVKRISALLDRIAETGTGGDFWNFASEPPALNALRDDPARAHKELIVRVAYRNPFTGEAATAEETVELLAFWKREFERNPGHGRRAAAGVGIARWKRREVRQLLWAGTGSILRFTRDTQSALAIGQEIVAWPSRMPKELPGEAQQRGIPFYQIEDGFIRSVGLGAACHPPFSIVLDRSGIHYDPSRPNDLETLLQSTEFSSDLMQRSQSLIDLIVGARISKYEAGGEAVPQLPRSRRRVLVTGQVEDDLSVLLGGGTVAGNLDLLRRAREAEPAAEIWFKPHPDVDAGLRKGKVLDQEALRYADSVVRNISMAALFDMIDGIHVLTSLAGFEALLRGIEVTTHGVPFYAGWGLTTDLGAVPNRRLRRLTLQELTAGVLLIYPRYLDPLTHLPCTPEILIHRLSERKAPQETWLTRLRHLQGTMLRMADELRSR